ncbi:MAG: Asp-tRNA(Asn)/Glu-tRNA(Gln) amidotransferase subunit GatA [Deltaproteobacteria bacterium]|nr:MAG: Asp-tRNA(Asn)/Glu-tRNA(Gln) amidotransferase subunit GatA [Deltaproteobacteria bacterium]
MTVELGTARAIQAAVARGDVSAREVARDALERADARSDLGAFLHLDEDRVLAAADRVDTARSKGLTLGALAGVPVAIKDNLCERGVPTTCASRILQGFESFYDAHALTRLGAAGGVSFGRANMDEFAMGSSGENSSVKPTLNPWDRSRVPGGSSSGSAVAVASGIVPLSLGSDTGGSIRQPAAFCGVVGLKPTWGRVSRRGLVAFASSLDQIGPFAVDVKDAALAFEAIAGHDPDDSTSSNRGVPSLDASLAAAEQSGMKGLRVGVPEESSAEGLDPEVARATERALALLEAAGAQLVPVSLPLLPWAIDTYYVIASAEASSNLARFDGVRYGWRCEDAKGVVDLLERTRTLGFGPEVRRRIMLGTWVLSAGYFDAYYGQAQRVRTKFRQDFERAFSLCDVILTPTTPSPAFRLGERIDDPLSMYLADIFTIPANLAGLPAMSVPVAHSSGGLPIGVQLVADAFEEPRLFQAAAVLERERGPLPALGR